MEVALTALKTNRPETVEGISAKELVEGHREKTLLLLWNIVFGFQLTTLLDLDVLREEIVHLTRSLRLKVRLGDKVAEKGSAWLLEARSSSPGRQTTVTGEGVQLLLNWCQLVLAHYNVEVENWTVSWCDGRALCFLVSQARPSCLEYC